MTAHYWELYESNASAFYSKRADGQTSDLFWTRGDIFKCRTCPMKIIRPSNPNLQTVEVEELGEKEKKFYSKVCKA